MILFDEYQQEIQNFCLNAIINFKKEKPEVVISNIALYCDPFLGCITVNLDSPNNSDNLVSEHLANSFTWYGQDEHGKFNDHCPDFEYSDYEILEIDEWRNEFEKNNIINIKYGVRKTQIDLSQFNIEVLNKAFFNFLKDILTNIINEEIFEELNKSMPFRAGIQIANSELYIEYWLFTE